MQYTNDNMVLAETCVITDDASSEFHLMPAQTTKDIRRQNLAKLMARDKLNGISLATLLDESAENVSRWLSGRASIKDSTVDKMIDRCGWSLAELHLTSESETAKRSDMDTLEALRVIIDACGFQRPTLKRKSQP